MKLIIICSLVLSSSAFANYELSKSNKAVTCYGDDSISVTLNAKKTTLKYVVEGESNGPQKIIKVIDDKKSSVTYVTKEFTLTLSDAGDTVLYHGDQEPMSFNDCR